MIRRLGSCFIFPFVFCISVFSQQSNVSNYKLRVGDINLGLDSRSLNTRDSLFLYQTHVGGISLRYQSSIMLGYYLNQPDKRFKVGDILSSEISVGYMQSNDPVQKLPIWFAYRFEMGASFLYSFTESSEVGLNLILLRFSRDFVTQNMSGSAIEARARWKRMVVEAGVDSRQLRILGPPVPYFNRKEEKNMHHLGIRYFLKPDQNLGFRLEWLQKKASNNGDGLFNFRLYWGKCF